MLAKFLIFLCEFSPRARRKLWHWWYERWATQVQAGTWTFMNYGFAWPGHERGLLLQEEDEPDRYCAQLYQRVIGSANLQGKRLLEVGAGRGGGAAFIVRYHDPAAFTAVDFSPQAVAWCRERHRFPHLSFVEGDAGKLPLANAGFDAVINVESSHCYPSVASFFAEVTRVLRPGGKFFFADLREAPEMKLLHQQLAALPGMEVVDTEDLTPQVAAALEADHGRKSQMINSLIPSSQQAMFREFAGLKGSRIHRNLLEKKLLYHRWILQRV